MEGCIDTCRTIGPSVASDCIVRVGIFGVMRSVRKVTYSVGDLLLTVAEHRGGDRVLQWGGGRDNVQEIQESMIVAEDKVWSK